MGQEQVVDERAELKERLREAENAAVEQGAILHWIAEALDGKPVCDFAESFPLVRRVVDLRAQLRVLEAELRDRAHGSGRRPR